MNAFFDTSALIKKYIDEEGSSKLENYFNSVDIVFVSNITKLECFSTVRRMLEEKTITSKELSTLFDEIEYDFKYFNVINYNDNIEDIGKGLLKKYQFKTLDIIQLSSCLLQKKFIDTFVCCDKKLIKLAEKEEVKVYNPLDK